MHASNYVDAALSDFLVESRIDPAKKCEYWSDESNEEELRQRNRCSSVETIWPSESSNPIEALNSTERTTKYLDKLYCMLEKCPSEIAGWSRNGTSFAVYDNDAFEKTIIPQYFKPVKFESFARQLNSYGFRKAKHHMNHTIVFEFRHVNFVRGECHRLDTIRRRQRIRRLKSRSAAPSAVDVDVKSTLGNLMNIIHDLKTELAETKALVSTLMNSNK